LAEFLADTYAFIELFEGNRRYRGLFKNHDLVTTSLNVVEVYSTLLRRIELDEAREFAQAALRLVIEVPRDTALRAAEIRTAMIHSKKNCSHVDAWGYAAAERLGREFLTGDEAFRDVSNVRFIK
jgi:predicted nucleic acid-binding protein